MPTYLIHMLPWHSEHPQALVLCNRQVPTRTHKLLVNFKSSNWDTIGAPASTAVKHVTLQHPRHCDWIPASR